MDAACEEFGIKVPKGVVGPPDIKPNLEATSEESPISPEAYSRYRRVLGRLAWLAQTRMDLLHYTSLLASGQLEPKPGHEKAFAAGVEICCHRQPCGATLPHALWHLC